MRYVPFVWCSRFAAALTSCASKRRVSVRWIRKSCSADAASSYSPRSTSARSPAMSASPSGPRLVTVSVSPATSSCSSASAPHANRRAATTLSVPRMLSGMGLFVKPTMQATGSDVGGVVESSTYGLPKLKISSTQPSGVISIRFSVSNVASWTQKQRTVSARTACGLISRYIMESRPRLFLLGEGHDVVEQRHLVGARLRLLVWQRAAVAADPLEAVELE